MRAASDDRSRRRRGKVSSSRKMDVLSHPDRPLLMDKTRDSGRRGSATASS